MRNNISLKLKNVFLDICSSAQYYQNTTQDKESSAAKEHAETTWETSNLLDLILFLKKEER